jgi:hypothetical protein
MRPEWLGNMIYLVLPCRVSVVGLFRTATSGCGPHECLMRQFQGQDKTNDKDSKLYYPVHLSNSSIFEDKRPGEGKLHPCSLE